MANTTLKTLIFNTAGSSTWTVPADWTNDNSLFRAIGAGGGARKPANTGGVGAGGGGGGGYSSSNNGVLTATAGQTVYLFIGTGGAGATANATNGGNGSNTWLNVAANSAPTATANGVLALGGSGSTSSTGGAGGSITGAIGTTTVAGGAGGSSVTNSGFGAGGGGGGSAGSNLGVGRAGGNGTNGGSIGTPQCGGGGGGGGTGGVGGNGSQGGLIGGAGGTGGLQYSGAAGASATTAGSNGGGGGGGKDGAVGGGGGNGGAGGAGTEYTITAGGTAGSGGGGGGGAKSDGGNGGLYGGGGGAGAAGGSSVNTNIPNNSGSGANGAVIVTYAANIDRYWVGGSGTWDSSNTSNWSYTSGGAGGAPAPTVTDVAIFNASSDSGAGFTVTVGAGATCKDLVFSSPDNLVTFAGSSDLTIKASVTLPASNFSIGTYSGTWQLTSTTSTTFTSNGRTIGNVTFNGAAGTWTLQDALTSSGTTTLTTGTLALGTNTLTTNLFAAGGTSTRVISFGTGKIVVTGNNTTVVNIGVYTGFSYTGTSRIELTYSGSTGIRGITSGQFNTSNALLNYYITAGTDAISINNTSSIETLDFTGFSGTWYMSSGTGNNGLNINKSLVVTSGMSIPSSTGILYLNAFGGTATVTTAGKTFDFAVITNLNGSGTATLNDSMTLGSGLTFNHYGAALVLNNNTLTTPYFASDNATARSISFGTGKIVVTGSGTTVVSMATMTNLTFTGTSRIELSYSGSTGTRTVNMGGTAGATSTNALSLYITAGSDTFTFATGSSVRILDFTGFSGTWSNVTLSIYSNLITPAVMTVGAGANVVTFGGTTSLTTNAETFDFPVTLNGTSLTLVDALTMGSSRTFTLTAGTLAIGSFTFTTGIFSSSGATTRAVTRSSGNITLTGNAATILTLTGSAATYGSGLAFTCTYAGATGTRTINSLATAVAINISAGTDTVTFTLNNSIGALNFTGFAGSWTNVGFTINGSLTVSSGMTVSVGANNITFGATGSITSNGKTFDFPVTFNGASATFTLIDALTVGTTRTLTFNNGTVNLNSITLTTGFVAIAAGTKSITFNGGTIVLTGAGTTVWNNANPTGFTTTAGSSNGTISLTSASAKTFVGAGSTYAATLNNGGAGNLRISGNNSFYDLTATGGDTIRLTAGSTNTFTNFSLAGTLATRITLNSLTAGTQATIVRPSGNVYTRFLAVKDIVASTVIWITYDSTDNGNNSGWMFAYNNPIMFF